MHPGVQTIRQLCLLVHRWEFWGRLLHLGVETIHEFTLLVHRWVFWGRNSGILGCTIFYAVHMDGTRVSGGPVLVLDGVT